MTEIIDNSSTSRYEISVDGELVGFAEYRLVDDVITLPHTVVFPQFEGNGYAGQLIKFALDDARSRGLQVIPTCSFVHAYIEKHLDYLDLVPPQRREQLGFPASA